VVEQERRAVDGSDVETAFRQRDGVSSRTTAEIESRRTAVRRERQQRVDLGLGGREPLLGEQHRVQIDPEPVVVEPFRLRSLPGHRVPRLYIGLLR